MQIDEFREVGFLNIGRVYSDEESDALRERLMAVIAVHYMPGWTRYEPSRSHIMERRVDVEPGEPLTGHYFPTVWDHGPIDPPKHWSEETD